MDTTRIVTGSKSNEKHERARQLRHEMTPAEALLWDRIRNRQLGGLHFRRQQVIDGFIVDFYCHAAGLIIELDGSVHYDRQEADRERESVLASCGLEVLRFSNDKIKNNLADVLAHIQSAAESRLRQLRIG